MLPDSFGVPQRRLMLTGDFAQNCGQFSLVSYCDLLSKRRIAKKRLRRDLASVAVADGESRDIVEAVNRNDLLV